MRSDVTFDSKGLKCRGWLYLPETAESGQKAPAIVMAHGFSAVKEQILPAIAERFADAGFAVVVFDYRYFGDSDGEPRSQIFPLEMVEDYRNAISSLGEQPGVDRDRIGVWGTSYSGGLAAHVGTVDRRVKAVVSQVPSLTNAETRRAMDPDRWERVGAFLIEDRIARYRTGAVNVMKIVDPDGKSCVYPDRDTYDAFMKLKDIGPNWRNQITIESLEKIREFDPVSLIRLLAPTPLLVIAAENDNLIPLEAIKAAYRKAAEPKELVVLPIKHFEIYEDPWLTSATDQAIAWFQKYLV